MKIELFENLKFPCQIPLEIDLSDGQFDYHVDKQVQFIAGSNQPMNLKDLYIRFVPVKIRRLRHIVAEGLLLRYLVKRWKYLRKPETADTFPYYFVIAAIVKNEAPYIVEWIEYHLLQGAEKIYIYDNESEDNLREVIAPYIAQKVVKYIFWPSKGLLCFDDGVLQQKWVVRIQNSAYLDAIKRLEKKAYWVAFIDIDEFIVPESKNNVSEILVDFEGQSGVAVNWLTYGHSGHIGKTDDLVVERFKSHSNGNIAFNRHTKLIVNPRYILRMENPHHAKTITGKNIVNTRNEEIETYCMNYPPCHEKMRINHYWTKSFDESRLRRRDGGGGGSRNQLIKEFVERQKEFNVVPYDGIMDKYIPVLKERIAKKGLF